MGATLADSGMKPLTRERVVDAIVCHYTLAAHRVYLSRASAARAAAISFFFAASIFG